MMEYMISKGFKRVESLPVNTFVEPTAAQTQRSLFSPLPAEFDPRYRQELYAMGHGVRPFEYLGFFQVLRFPFT
ncbi:hypothetical protein MHBO_002577 [Bonamia ostreae]|uniref:Uncharacterized protein n=1 Tax=Bonamia ostreae TaxID=126728 RepID=A0ABV2AMT0_9EUKA